VKIVSFIGESHNKVSDYSIHKLLELIKGMKPARVIITMDPNAVQTSGGYSEKLNDITKDSNISGLITFANADETKYYRKRAEFFEKYATSAETVVKKNILEMIETTIHSYLEGYWKDYETVNSEVTDELFRAKHKLISSMFWEVERETWNALLEEMAGNIESLSPGADDVILVDVEKRYWLLERMENN